MNIYKKKICVVTGSRSEYGLLKDLILKIKKSKKLKLILMVTGMHLSKRYGFTYKEILKDKLQIKEKIRILKNDDSSVAISQAVSKGIKNFSKKFKKHKPHLLVVLGDRFEIFSAATAAMLSRIPIVHIHGGEITEGSIDDAIRHSITKMSHVHFVTNKVYKKNVIQLGESPKNVFLVSGLGADFIKNNKFLSKDLLEKNLKFKFLKKNILVNFHPETLEAGKSKKHIVELLRALKKFQDTRIIFTMPNSDHESKIIFKEINKFVQQNKNSKVFKSLGNIRYLSCMKFCSVIIGNSSSGILEAPYLKIPTINIGDRQKGRIQTKSITNCPIKEKKIFYTLNNILNNKKNKIYKIKNNKSNASKKIISFLEKKVDLGKLIKKKFYQL